METFFYYAGIASAAALGLLALVWAAAALARAWRRRDPRLREVRQAQALRLRRLEEARAMGRPEMDEQEKRRRFRWSDDDLSRSDVDWGISEDYWLQLRGARLGIYSTLFHDD